MQQLHKKQTIFAIFSTPKSATQKAAFHHARYSYFLLYEKKKSVAAAAAAAAAEIHPDDLSGAPGAHQSLQLDELKRFMPSKKIRQKSSFPKMPILSRLVLPCIDEFLNSFCTESVEHKLELRKTEKQKKIDGKRTHLRGPQDRDFQENQHLSTKKSIEKMDRKKSFF